MSEIIKHIRSARDWLDRAERKVNLGELLEGEMFLSLAEAEVRKARENSLAQRQGSKARITSRGTIATSLVFLSILVVILMLTLGIFDLGFFQQEPEITLSSRQMTEESLNLHNRDQLRLVNMSLTINNK